MIWGKRIWQNDIESAADGLRESPKDDFPAFKEIIAQLKNVLDLRIPTGYQDDAGFHFGAQIAPCEFEI